MPSIDDGSVLGTAPAIGNETLFVGINLLLSALVPGLELGAKPLLDIWDALAVEMVEVSSARALAPIL